MGKLRYYYGAMNSLKTGTLLTKVYQFEQCGCNTILLKPFFDTRDVEIKSRAISDSRPCISFGSRDNLLEIIPNHMVHDKLNVVFVDEVNFITKYQVRQLWKLSKEYDVDVFVMGDDWKGKFDDLSDICRVVYLPRTPDVSSTELKNSLREEKE